MSKQQLSKIKESLLFIAMITSVLAVGFLFYPGHFSQKERKVGIDTYTFTAMSQCKEVEKQLGVSCEHIFEVSKNRASIVGGGFKKLDDCQKEFGDSCKMENGKIKLKSIGAFYIVDNNRNSKMIAPIIISAAFNNEMSLISQCTVPSGNNHYNEFYTEEQLHKLNSFVSAYDTVKVKTNAKEEKAMFRKDFISEIGTSTSLKRCVS